MNIKTDSRKIKPGDTFVALRCEEHDGHAYVQKAIENGASKVVVEHGSYSVETVVVPDTREYINEYLDEHYAETLENMKIIGITGTNGKTTTAYLAYQLFRKLQVPSAYIGTIGFYLEKKEQSLPNTSVDVCDLYELLLTAYEHGCKVVLLEVSSQALSGNRFGKLKFDMAAFTNLTQDHLNFHKTMGNYALAKQLLFKKIKKDGLAIVNEDDKYKDYYLLSENHNITYGFKPSDYQIKEYQLSAEKTKFKVEYKGSMYPVETNLIGSYNIYNLLVAMIFVNQYGFPFFELLKHVKDLNSPSGRMEVISYKDNQIIIDYAHTPDAIEKILKTVKEFSLGKIYTIFGCTGERDRKKRPIMMNLVTNLSDKVIVTNDDPHFESPTQIVSDMVDGITKKNYEICLDRKKAIAKGISWLKEKDTLLILGKGHEEFIVIENKKIKHNDKEEVLKIISSHQKI